ncbi:MAG: hypothetical protein LBR07_09660 [Puniceicoccales bacterium]|jgi:uncharacterized membrane protein|nr:hypothetical protein [Puniceicoccales bacterium]
MPSAAAHANAFPAAGGAVRIVRAALNIATGVVLLAYPFAVWLGLTRWGVTALAPLLLALLALRGGVLLLPKNENGTGNDGGGGVTGGKKVRALAVAGALASVAGAALAALAWLFRRGDLLLYYPVAVNALFLGVFATSLLRPPSVCERLALLMRPDLPAAGAAYARNVTRVWCAFFVLNGAAALATCLHGDLALWTLYNGAVSYALIGALFAGEYLVRHRVIARHETAPTNP